MIRGAKSSSLHVEDIEELAGNKIQFYVVLGGNKRRKKVTASTIRKGKVKSSTGYRTHRWFVQTKIRLGHIERLIKINLVGREEMNFRMLIGRTALEDDFLVDVSHKGLLNKKLPVRKANKKKNHAN